MKRTAATPGLVALTMSITALIVGLHQLGNVEGLSFDWSDPIRWLDHAAAEDALGALLRSIGLVAGYWIMFSTLLYTATTIRPRSNGSRLIRLVTLPGIRKMVDRALATALAASIAAAPLTPALADEQPPAVVFDINTDGIPIPHVQPGYEIPNDDELAATAQPDRTDSIPAITITPPPITQTQITPSPTSTYIVESGDNLWGIADNRMQSAAEIKPTTAAVTEYWRRLIDANRPTLRSGDPNLIYPGEIITIPPLEVGK